MSQPEKPEDIECVLCRKKYPMHRGYGSQGQISGWRKVCDHCIKLWELGKKKTTLAKTDGKMGHAAVKLVLKMDGRDGNEKGDTTIKSADIIAAMGGVKLKGTSLVGRFSAPEGTIRIGKSGEYDWGATEVVQVPEARAKAMDKILNAFHSALANVRVDGFNHGRNLLAGLAKGELRIETFDEQVNNARAGRKPRGSWG